MNKFVIAPTLLALSIGLAACSSQPNANLEEARSAYSALQSDPRASQVAALETQDAGKSLDRANKAYLEDADAKVVDQLAYVTKRRVELAQQTIALRSAEQALQNTDAERAQAVLDGRNAQIKKLQEKLQAKQTDRGTLVTFGDVLFDLNRADLKPEGVRNVAKLADFLRDNPERQVIVEGYTDSTGSVGYNQQLSEHRAQAVQITLIKMGINPSRIVAQGYGKQYPVSSNSTNSGRAMNRRVEVTISNDDQPVAPRTSMGR